MIHEKQESKWENCHKYYLFFMGLGYFFILLGLILSWTGTMGLLKGSGLAFFLIAQVGFFATLFGYDVFKHIAMLWKHRIVLERIPIKSHKLMEATHNSIKISNFQETEIEQKDPKYHIIALVNGIKIKVLVHPQASFGVISIHPYKEDTKEFIDSLTNVINEEIRHYSQEHGVIERAS